MGKTEPRGPAWVIGVEYLRGPSPEGKSSGESAAPKVDVEGVDFLPDFRPNFSSWILMMWVG